MCPRSKVTWVNMCGGLTSTVLRGALFTTCRKYFSIFTFLKMKFRLLVSGGGDAGIKLWSLHKQLNSVNRSRTQSGDQGLAYDVEAKQTVSTLSMNVSTILSSQS